MAKEKELKDKLEETSIELYLIRNLKNKIDKKNEDFTKEIKEIMLDQLGIDHTMEKKFKLKLLSSKFLEK